MTIKNNYDYTSLKRQGAYTDRLKAKGLKQVRVWVYLEDEQKLRDHAAELVEERDKLTE